MDVDRWTSRKLLLTIAGVLVMATLPIIYVKLGIGENITLVVVGAIAGACGIYNVSNVMAKKWAPVEPVTKMFGDDVN